MSTRTWTPQQRQAIEDRGGALLLSAAAGSGKTAVLTQRAVERLADENAGVEADRLLIVTFTNAAAAELRQRMTAALEEKLAQRPDSVWLKRQKLLLGRASICTVDSFCIDLLTQHASETDLPGDFTVIKTAQETALRQEALEQALEEAYQDEAFCRFASLYGKARSDRAAADAVLRLYDMACSMAQPEAWWASLPEAYAVHAAPADTAWGRELLEAAAMTLRGVQGRLRYALSLAQENEELAPCAEVLRDDLAQVQGLLQAAQAADWDACCARARALSFLRFPRVSKQADPVEKGRVQALRDEAKKLLRELPEKYFAADAAAFAAEQEICRPMVQALAAAVRRFSDLLYEKKQEAKAFAFDDLEHAALRLLQDENGERTPLSQELGGYYAMVMVDEYQDTNDLQDRLYRLLARPGGSNLFFVGDVKQSIYGFREARPEFFMQKRDAFAAYDGRHYPATVYLSRNFRSTPSVIRGINDIFAPLFCRAVGGTAYAGDEALTPGVETDPIQAPVQVIVTDTTPQEDAPPPPAGALPVKVSVSALSHRTAEPVLDKPAFLYREGMTSAQRGTTLHRFLQLADLAAARQDLPRELERLTNEGYLEAEAAAQIDRPALQRFLHSALLQRMLSAQRLLREYEFISRIPAALTVEEGGDAAAGETVFLLGIADCVLCNGTDAELVDYKTDRGKTPQQFLQAYAPQLSLYRQAIEKRLGVTVRRSVIYSFDLGREIEVP